MLAAHAVAILHAAAVVLMLTGALLALRRPRLLLVHAPLSAAILAVNLADQPCPLTVLELELRALAGGSGYTGGFLGHYLFEPLGVDVASPVTQAGIYTVALLPNLVGYGLHAARARAGRRARAASSAGPREPVSR